MNGNSVVSKARKSKDMFSAHPRYLAAINGTRVLCRAIVVLGSIVMGANANHSHSKGVIQQVGTGTLLPVPARNIVRLKEHKRGIVRTLYNPGVIAGVIA